MIQQSFQTKKPTLYLISTPIGNLKDMTYRAVEILNLVDIIFAEDTRTSGVLLKHYHIKKQLISYNDQNETIKSELILSALKEDKDVALISDAGTPLISDPGYEVVRVAIDQGFHVVAIPGASAILAALVTSGLVVQPFVFSGFLPRKQQELINLLKKYQTREETMVFYESPKRIQKTVQTMYEVLGQRKVVFARELTKMFESIDRTTLEEAKDVKMEERGEYVIVLEGNKQKEDDNLSVEAYMALLLGKGMDEKEALKVVAKAKGVSKRDIYKIYKIDK
jgi:16S rRNA (cytidine1402-2'-O)-methyltransferase